MHYQNPSESSPALIAVDWGTTNLRAYLLDHRGDVIDSNSIPGGIMSITDRQFHLPLLKVVGSWLKSHPLPLISAGMIGSRQGWQEAPYLPCPARLEEAATQLTSVVFQDEKGRSHQLNIAPGLRCTDQSGLHDVMRGEETQIWGADLPSRSVCILPGTHCKWAWTNQNGHIEHFTTFMTGELFALLTKHSILGRLMSPGQDDHVFKQGVLLGMQDKQHATHLIFSTRTAGLMGTLPTESLADYLSGLLIGLELGSSSVVLGSLPKQIYLIGDDDLCCRYAKALNAAGIEATRSVVAPTAGLWKLAKAAKLLLA
jgi:2-dehydro-3-deoxygalactonokinase